MMSKVSGKLASQRQLRVAEAIRHLVVDCLERGRLRDPALSECGITVTEVSISPDLRNATIYVTPFLGKKETVCADDYTEILDGLNRAGFFLRRLVAREIRLRFPPRIGFAFDDRFERVEALDQAFRSPGVARDLGKDTGV